MIICEEHDKAVVVYDALTCPVCDEIDALKNEIEGV
jgi:hypothetical protein